MKERKKKKKKPSNSSWVHSKNKTALKLPNPLGPTALHTIVEWACSISSHSPGLLQLQAQTPKNTRGLPLVTVSIRNGNNFGGKIENTVWLHWTYIIRDNLFN